MFYKDRLARVEWTVVQARDEGGWMETKRTAWVEGYFKGLSISSFCLPTSHQGWHPVVYLRIQNPKFSTSVIRPWVCFLVTHLVCEWDEERWACPPTLIWPALETLLLNLFLEFSLHAQCPLSSLFRCSASNDIYWPRRSRLWWMIPSSPQLSDITKP